MPLKMGPRQLQGAVGGQEAIGRSRENGNDAAESSPGELAPA